MDINGFYAPAGSSYYASPIAGELSKSLKQSPDPVTGNLANAPGVLHFVGAANTSAAVKYLQVWDTAGAPGTGKLLLPPIPIAANGMNAFPLPYAIPFTAGCVLAMSSTQTSYTAGGANDGQFFAITK